MLKDIANTVLKSKMLSAACECYLPVHSHSPMLSATLVPGQNPAFKHQQYMHKTNGNSYKYFLRNFLRFFSFWRAQNQHL